MNAAEWKRNGLFIAWVPSDMNDLSNISLQESVQCQQQKLSLLKWTVISPITLCIVLPACQLGNKAGKYEWLAS